MTVLERAIAAAHLPFSVGCFLIALIGGTPGTFLVFYLGTHSLTEAWSKTASTSFSTTLSTVPQVSTPVAVVTSTVFTFSIFLVLYWVRYLRRKVQAAELKLSALAADGAAGYTRAFSVMGSTAGIAFFTVIFFLLYFPPRAQASTDSVSLVGMVVVSLIVNLVDASAFWTYLSGVWGVYRFGRERLTLRPFYDDRLLGLRPLGQVVTTFALIFSVAITVALGSSLVVGAVDSIAVTCIDCPPRRKIPRVLYRRRE